MGEKLITPKDASERLVVAEKTIKDWLRAGKLRGVKVGSLWRIREVDLEKFIEGGN